MKSEKRYLLSKMFGVVCEESAIITILMAYSELDTPSLQALTEIVTKNNDCLSEIYDKLWNEID